jgi:ribonuclease HI
MEIRAVLEAVRSLDGELLVVSDSTYVVNCFRDGWWRRWTVNGWRTASRQPVANVDLWQPLVALYEVRRPSFRWVKGHSGDPMNDLVDRLAVAAAAGPFSAAPAPEPGVVGPPAASQPSLFGDDAGPPVR